MPNTFVRAPEIGLLHLLFHVSQSNLCLPVFVYKVYIEN